MFGTVCQWHHNVLRYNARQMTNATSMSINKSFRQQVFKTTQYNTIYTVLYIGVNFRWQRSSDPTTKGLMSDLSSLRFVTSVFITAVSDKNTDKICI